MAGLVGLITSNIFIRIRSSTLRSTDFVGTVGLQALFLQLKSDLRMGVCKLVFFFSTRKAFVVQDGSGLYGGLSPSHDMYIGMFHKVQAYGIHGPLVRRNLLSERRLLLLDFNKVPGLTYWSTPLSGVLPAPVLAHCVPEGLSKNLIRETCCQGQFRN